MMSARDREWPDFADGPRGMNPVTKLKLEREAHRPNTRPAGARRDHKTDKENMRNSVTHLATDLRQHAGPPSRPRFRTPNLPSPSSSRRSGLGRLRLGELWEYRELVYFLIWRDVKVRYKQTVLGAALGDHPAAGRRWSSSASSSGGLRGCRRTACRIRCSRSRRWCRGLFFANGAHAGANSLVATRT